MSNVKTGFIADEPDERDLTFGSDNSIARKFGAEVLCPDSNWSEFLPEPELQAQDYETQGCVSYNTLNIIEILKRRLSDVNENLSDRFVAKASGTDPYHGNNPRKVADTIKKKWSVFEGEYPRPKTLEEFYAEIPQKLFTLAAGRGAEYEFGYEPKVAYKDIREALKYSPLGISVPAWFKDESGRYYRPAGQNDTHWCVCYGILPNGDLLIFDSYYPFQKILRADVVPSTIYSYYLKRQVKQESFWQSFIKLIQQLFVGEVPVYPDDVPHGTPVPTTPLADPVPEPRKDRIKDFALAIQEYEGFYPTSRAYRNNNPGNLKYVGQWGTSGKDDKGFAIFKSYDIGFNALKTMLRNACTGVSKVYKPDFSIYEFFAVYSPTFDDNDPHAYAKWVANKIGVNPDEKIKNLVA